MSNSNSIVIKALGLALIVVGVGLAYWGYQMSEGLAFRLAEQLSGSQPDEVMYRYIGGAACGVVGLFLAIKG